MDELKKAILAQAATLRQGARRRALEALVSNPKALAAMLSLLGSGQPKARGKVNWSQVVEKVLPALLDLVGQLSKKA